MSIKERIKKIRKESGQSQDVMASTISISRDSLAAIETGRQNPTIDTIIEIVKKYHEILPYVTHEWLLVGETTKKGQVKHKSSTDRQKLPRIVTVDSSGEENILFVPVKARAGYLNGYTDEGFISSLPSYKLPGLNNGTFRMFEVSGLSMHPTLDDHDIIVTQFVENFKSLRDDRVYVVVTRNDGIVVKRVLNRIESDGKLILKSDNYRHREDYPPIVVSPDDVVEMWYGIAYLSRQMRPPADIYTRMIDLESRVTLLENLKVIK